MDSSVGKIYQRALRGPTNPEISYPRPIRAGLKISWRLLRSRWNDAFAEHTALKGHEIDRRRPEKPTAVVLLVSLCTLHTLGIRTYLRLSWLGSKITERNGMGSGRVHVHEDGDGGEFDANLCIYCLSCGGYGDLLGIANEWTDER